MKKYVGLTVFLLVACCALSYQWFRADKETKRLNARLHGLQRDLAKINMVRKNLPALEEEINNTERLFATLRKRLPAETWEETYIEQIVKGFRTKNVKMVFYHSDSVNKDFYKEIALVFHYDREGLEDSVIREVFQDMDRVVHWENNKEDKVLVTTIYSSHQEIGQEIPKITSCGNPEKANLPYWPFNEMVRRKIDLIEEQCLKKKSDEILYAKIKRLEHRKASLHVLISLLQQLDPEYVVD